MDKMKQDDIMLCLLPDNADDISFRMPFDFFAIFTLIQDNTNIPAALIDNNKMAATSPPRQLQSLLSVALQCRQALP